MRHLFPHFHVHGNSKQKHHDPDTNPYKEKLNIARELAEKIGGQLPEVSETELPTQEEAAKMVDDLNSRLKELNDKKEKLQAQIQTLKRSKDQVAPFTELNYSVKEIQTYSASSRHLNITVSMVSYT